MRARRAKGCGLLAMLLAAGCGGDGAAVSSDGGVVDALAAVDACPGGVTAAMSVAISLPVAGGKLAGTLQLPAGCGPFPVALIIAGSGPTDRDGNDLPAGLDTDCYKELADALAGSGFASVRYDKRGVAGSAGVPPLLESDVRFGMFVDDAVGWVKKLSADPRLRGVVLAGHSEGSLIAIRAAQATAVQAIVSLEGAGRPLGEVLRGQLAAQLAGALLAQANAIIDALEAGMTVDTVPAPLATLFRASVQPFLISEFQFDPAMEFKKTSAPALIVQGNTDIQVGVADADLLAAARPDARRLLVDGMNHVLKLATLDPSDQQAAYTDPTLPLAPALLDGLLPFLRGVARP
jgi:pimeloyl-ACP methyl ester carboxylesterase